MSPMEKKQILLARLNRAFDAYVNGMYAVACKPGCPSCCTGDVTVTTLEAYQIYNILIIEGKMDVDHLRSIQPTGFRPTYTTNDFASACLEHRALPDEGPGPDGSPCQLLKDDRCPLYDVRPFACRSFLSLKHCVQSGQAEIPSSLASVIGACQQIIEHIDVLGHYGNLLDMLILLTKDDNAGRYAIGRNLIVTGMPATQPLPGFLVPPEDRREVNAFLSRLFNIKMDGRTYQEAMSTIRPLPTDIG